jgi:valyl-tRNA synthetase
MIMLGLECTDDIPFDTVYLHGLIRDEHGQKMSKSRGNAIDPLEVINQYGTDALRFTLLTGSTPGNDMKLALSRVEANRNFANKIWNATRFVVSNLGYGFTVGWGTWDMGALTLGDRWILSRHNRLIADVTRLIDAYQFGEAGRQIYDFLWGGFCDWYIEVSKIRLYGKDARRRLMAQRVLAYVLERVVRLLHPFMPFVTEALWQELPHEGESLMVAPWPEPGDTYDEAEEEMSLVMDAIRAVRNARAEYEVEAGQHIEAIIAAGERYDLLVSQRGVLVSLARLDDEKLRLAHTLVKKPAKALTLVVGGLEIYLPLEGMLDLAAERERLTKEVGGLSAAVTRSEGLLANEDFTRKAPVHVVDREREKLAANREQKAKLEERLKSLEA